VKYAPFGLLRPLQLPKQPWDSISMDFITGHLPVEGCNALWVIMDQLTKIVHFVACADTMGMSDLADGFISHLV
jgi:hypothetical protein